MRGVGEFPSVRVAAGVSGIAEAEMSMDENGELSVKGKTGAYLTSIGVPPIDVDIAVGPNDQPMGQFVLAYEDFQKKGHEVRYWTGDFEIALEWADEKDNSPKNTIMSESSPSDDDDSVDPTVEEKKTMLGSMLQIQGRSD